eukprot:TRINITY_DN4424_c0_g2_i1.p1 TRINITY_DN4424_c0_g2~~TRINITY_DN4424_c0_g2_i1.p1  ORF type:complete len:398 (-),score=56.93 TRINITY_DN4424_c0_g2_i1:58-1251(-)
MAGGGKGALVDRAVIIGGGIGGLATAIALHKVGINATVYERSELADRLTAAGTMVSIFANGMKALHAMDPAIPIKLRERGAVVKRIMMYSPTGDVISDSINEEMGNALMIQWSRILETFLEFLPPSCIQSGYTCTGVAEVDDEVEVYLVKNGEASTVKAPLVIGSDGVRSIIRDYVLEDKPIGARDLGRRCWRAIIPAPKPLDPLPESTVQWLFDIGKNGLIVTLGSEQIYWAVVVQDEHGGVERSASTEEMVARVKAYFPDWDNLQLAIDATDVELMLERRIVDTPDVPTWSRGRVLIIGDAAHALAPAMGQGANLAMEDALELARQLISASTLQEAFSLMLEERQPRVRAIREVNEAGIRKAYSKDANETQDSQKEFSKEFIANYDRLLEPLSLT